MPSILETLNLKNFELGRVQSDDEMMLVPLVRESRGDVAAPENLRFKNTTHYGTMVFENTDPDPLFRLCTKLHRSSIINHQQHPKHTPTRVRVVSSSLVDGYLSSTENAAISYHFFDERECKDYTKVQKPI